MLHILTKRVLLSLIFLSVMMITVPVAYFTVTYGGSHESSFTSSPGSLQEAQKASESHENKRQADLDSLSSVKYIFPVLFLLIVLLIMRKTNPSLFIQPKE